jgi:hypothetical protein
MNFGIGSMDAQLSFNINSFVLFVFFVVADKGMCFAVNKTRW